MNVRRRIRCGPSMEEMMTAMIGIASKYAIGALVSVYSGLVFHTIGRFARKK